MNCMKQLFWLLVALVLLGGLLGFRALASTPTPAIQQLLVIETQLAISRKELTILQGEVARLEQEVRKQSEQVSALREALKQQQEKLGQWLSYVYRRGPTPFLALLLGAEDFGDFAAKYTLLSHLVRYGLNQAEATEAALAAVEQKQAALEKELTTLQTKKEEAAAAVARLAALQAEKQAALARAEAEAAASGKAQEDIRRLLDGWQQSLPALAYLVTNFARLPWQNLQPDGLKVDYRHLTVEAFIAEETLRRTLAADPPLARLTVRVKPGAVYVEGPDFVLTSRVETEGDRIRLVPQELRLPAAEVGEGILRDLFSACDLSFPFESPYPGLRLRQVEAQDGRVVLHLSIR